MKEQQIGKNLKKVQAGVASSARMMPTCAPTRRERLENREAAIVRAAFHHFGEKGFAKSTISEVARAAGVAEGTVYLYFKNKEALAEAVLGQFYDELTDGAAAGVEGVEGAREQLEFLAQYHLENVIRQRHILHLLSVIDREGVSAVGGLIYEMNRKYVAIFDTVVREGALRGDFPTSCTKWVIRDIFYGSLDYAAKSILIRERAENAIAIITSELVDMLIGPRRASVPSRQAGDVGLEKIVQRMERAVGALEAETKVLNELKR